MSFFKKPRIILDKEHYRALQQQVFAADHWCCRICHRVRPLQMHHVIPRSLGRMDTLTNCISLCHTCHSYVTDKWCSLVWDDCARRTVIVTWRDGKSRIAQETE